ncbi:hypothetical protein BZL29_3561 [Mycobacterium kansasii]|uniref:Uncharacterized protein n=1 Tax=Mycobacterium kansasii TaxID=1768 RepID=A0A1V3XDD8_MYCKA|nr:hypothetical protein BZL29_3561 [Mycobacterium kansasii]
MNRHSPTQAAAAVPVGAQRDRQPGGLTRSYLQTGLRRIGRGGDAGGPDALGAAMMLSLSEAAIQTHPGPVMASEPVAPLAPTTVPKSIRPAGVGSPNLGRIWIDIATSWGESVVPGAIWAPLRSVAAAVVMVNDIRRVA